jgi:transposase
MKALAEEQGTQAEYHIDNEGRVGHIHTVHLYPEDISVIYPQHRSAWGRQLQSYLPREEHVFDPQDSLYHPKVGALYKKANSTETVAREDRDELLAELDETVLNALSWPDIPIDMGSGDGGGPIGEAIFISDDHFEPETRLERAIIYPDPTPELQAEQGDIIMWAIDQIPDTESDRDITEALATDGGMDRDRLAEKTGWSMSTLYRAIDRLDGAIESRNGHFRFASRELRREFQALLEHMEDTAPTVKRQTERWLDVEIRSKSNSAFERFLAKYGGESKQYDDQDQPVIRIGTVLSTFKSTDAPMLEAVVAQLKSAWRNDGRDLDSISNARVEADLDNGERFTSVLAAI